jgi:hypothetical protein
MAKKYEGKNPCCTCFNKYYPDGNGDIATPCDLCDFENYYQKCSIQCFECHEKDECEYYQNKIKNKN